MNPVSHLWQSTLCVGVAALLTFALRRSSARTRHLIWLFASLKFLIPFSLFVVAGSYAGAWMATLATPGVSVTVRWLEESLSLWSFRAAADPTRAGFSLGLDRTVLLTLVLVWVSGVAALTMWRWRQWHTLSALARAATRLEYGREADAFQRIRRSSGLGVRGALRPRRIELLQCRSDFEPGVLGVFRPRLLWPAGLSDRLTDAELEAILTHEACHVDRLDNLSALIQVVVETVFWFHPVVWWLGARLVEERERACDEEVLQVGTDKQKYAEGILKVCGFCLRSPVAFVAGVGGSHLTQRIEWILTRPLTTSLSMPMRVVLAGVVIATAGMPLAAGALSAHRGTALAAGQDEPKVFRPGKGVTQPKLMTEVKPEYTPQAMEARIQGIVRLEAVVLESGLVGEVTIVRSLDTEYGLDDEAVKALKQWRFVPGTKDDKPVAVLIEVEMSFTLK